MQLDTSASTQAEKLCPGIEKIVSGNLSDWNWLDSLIVLKDGKAVYESYFHGEAEDLREVYSSTKSCLSCLIGIALYRGDIPSLDQRLVEIFPNRLPAKLDERKKDITLRHCLAMQSGLDYQNTWEFAELFSKTADPVDFFFSDHLPVIADPGVVWCYSGADSQMVSEVLVACTGRSASELVREWLFEPLGIDGFRWPRAFPVEGASEWPAETGASGLALTTRDFAKLTECIRQHGRYHDRQIIPKDWLDTATTPQPGVDSEFLANFYQSLGLPHISEMLGYGYHFGQANVAGTPNPIIAGMGGQYGFIFREMNLSIVQTANFEGDGLSGGVELAKLISEIAKAHN